MMENLIETESFERASFIQVPISISKIEIEAMKNSQDLIDVVEVYVKVASDCLIESITEKYPHLVKAQPEVGL